MNNQSTLTKNQRIALIAAGILAGIALVVYIYLAFVPKPESTKTTAATYTDSASGEKITVGGQLTNGDSDTDTSTPSFIGFGDMSDCGMTQYNVTALRTALTAYAPLKNTIVNLYTDSMKLKQDSNSSAPPQCTFKIKVNSVKNYPNDPKDYTVVDTLDNINTAHVQLKSPDGSTLFTSQLVTAS